MKVFQEITPVTNSDVFVILDSTNKGFDYPIHNHPEFELNLVMGCSGNRIVGDSTEKYEGEDLVLIGPYLFHKWDDHDQKLESSEDCRVITVQFGMNLFDSPFLGKKPFSGIQNLLKNASRGIRFTGSTFSQAKDMLIYLSQSHGLESVIQFLQLLGLLSDSRSYRYLTSVGFDHSFLQANNTRLHAAYQYIIRFFTSPSLRMSHVAAHVCLSDSAFSHFFKKYTNRSFSEFLIDMRMGHAGKLLIDTDDLISDICFGVGFNNLANFNRLFKKKYQVTPRNFRKKYQLKSSFDWSKQMAPGQFLPKDQKNQSSVLSLNYANHLPQR